MSFKVDKASSYEGRFPTYNQPLEIGSFSLDGDRNYCDDKRQLKYLAMPQNMSGLSMDLNEGYGKVIKKDFGKKEKLDTMLKWIVSHQDVVKKHFGDPNTSNIRINFVCFRGLLTVICNTIYEHSEDWIICATKFKNIIYLCAFETEQAINRRENMSEREQLMCSWGYKFEQYVTSDTMTSRPDTSVPVNEKAEYCSIMKGKLQDHRILFSAELDGVDPSYFNDPERDPTSMQRYAELKTSKIILNERVRRSFVRFKLLKWWLQSFLAGLPKVICGFRDDNGIVRKLEEFKVRDMPKMAVDCWSASACLNFGSQFLNFVKESVVKDDPLVVYKFYWRHGFKVSCEELQCPSEYQILPDWYIENLTI